MPQLSSYPTSPPPSSMAPTRLGLGYSCAMRKRKRKRTRKRKRGVIADTLVIARERKAGSM